MSAAATSMEVAAVAGVVCVKISGAANFNASPGFKAVAQQLCADQGHALLMDLTDCVTMDSTFLGVLARLSQRMNQPIELLNPADRILSLLDNLGVLELFKIGHGANPLTTALEKAEALKEAKDADEMFRDLMGDDVEPRRALIEKYAHTVENIDI